MLGEVERELAGGERRARGADGDDESLQVDRRQRLAAERRELGLCGGSVPATASATEKYQANQCWLGIVETGRLRLVASRECLGLAPGNTVAAGQHGRRVR